MNSARAANFNYDELSVLITGLEQDRELVTNELGKTIKNIKEQNERWDSIASLVNAVGHGRERTGKQVRKKWTELKCKIKKKAADLKNEQLKTGGREINYELQLTDLENRILQLIGKSTYEGVASLEFDLAAPNNPPCLAPDVNCIPLKPGSSADSSTVDQIEEAQESREKESSTLIVKLQSDAAAPKTVSEEVRKYRGVAKKKVQKLNNAVHLKTRSNSTILRKKYDALTPKMRMKELGNTQTDYSQSMPADYSSTEQLLSEAHSGISEDSRSSSGSESVQELVTEVTEENINDISSQNSYTNTPKKKRKFSNHSNFERMEEFGMLQLLLRQNKLLEGIEGTLKRIEKSLDDRSREVQRKSSMLVYISENIEKLAESLGGVSKSLKTIAEE